MSDLIIVNFRSAKAAFDAGVALAELQGRSGVTPEDIVVLARAGDGRLSVNQSIDQATGKTLGGGTWGLLIGMMCLGTPGVPNSGMAPRFREAGVDIKFLQEMERAPPKTGASVGMRVRALGADRVAEFLKSRPGSGKLIRTRLSPDAEEKLSDTQAIIAEGAAAHLDIPGFG